MQRELHVKLGKKTVYVCTWRSVLYTLCFFLLCVIDQRIKTCSGLDGLIETFRNLTGVAVGVMILSHYKRSDYKAHRLPFLILAALCAAGGAAAVFLGVGRAVFFNAYLAAVADVILFCFIALHTFFAAVTEKRRPVLKRSFLAVWAVMMALMIISRSNYLWPVCFLVMFGCLYLTDFSPQEREELLQGALNGIILGFFVLQGLCFAVRPFDNLRYQGIYHNPNLNALFYLEVLAAVLGKLVYVYGKKTGRAVKVYYWLGAGVVLSFLFLSIGRAAWVAAFFLVLVFLWALGRIQRTGLPQNKKRGRFWRNAGILILCSCLMFPACFSAARYLPAVFRHPVWFWGEYSEERVHSYDPWNTWKYVEIDEFMEAAVGRIIGSFENLWEHTFRRTEPSGNSSGEGGGEQNVRNPADSGGESAPGRAGNGGGEAGGGLAGRGGEGKVLVLAGSGKEGDVLGLADNGGDKPVQGPAEGGSEPFPGEGGQPRGDAVLSAEQEADSFLTRKTIYTYYIKRLNLRGYPEEEQGFQLTPIYHIGHAHNIFLQFGTDFGIPVMLLFAALIVWGGLRLGRGFAAKPEARAFSWLLFLLVPALFGMFEYAWGTGSLSVTMLFFAFGAAMEERER